MPVLDISADSLGHPLTMDYIVSVMLWPQDEVERSKYMRSARAALLTRNVREATPDELDLLFKLAREALPADVMRPKVEARLYRGFLAGELLGAAVLEHPLAGVVKLESLKVRMVEPKRRKAHHALNFSRRTLESAIWREFKPVAHFWAACAHFAFDEGAREFPWPPGCLPRFLAVAEFFRREATSIRSDRRSEPLLPEDQLWLLPPGLPIDRVELRRVD